MNEIIAIYSLLFLLSSSLLAQNTKDDLDQIRNWFKEINANINQFKKVELRDIQVYKDISPEKYSIEGDDIYRLAAVNMTKFSDGDKLIKLVVTFDGDREDLVSAYYFREGDLFFVDKSRSIIGRSGTTNLMRLKNLSPRTAFT